MKDHVMKHQTESESCIASKKPSGGKNHFQPPPFEDLPNGAYVREAQLVQSPSRPNSQAPLPFSAPTLWRKVKAGTFPKSVKLSDRVTAWKVEHVRNWLAEQEAL